MKTIQLNGLEVSVNDKVSTFDIHQKPSSNVEFFGIDMEQDKLFMQFKNGTTYIYAGLPIDLLKNIPKAESIGKFFSAHISGKFASEKITERLVKPVGPEEELEPSFV